MSWFILLFFERVDQRESEKKTKRTRHSMSNRMCWEAFIKALFLFVVALGGGGFIVVCHSVRQFAHFLVDSSDLHRSGASQWYRVLRVSLVSLSSISLLLVRSLSQSDTTLKFIGTGLTCTLSRVRAKLSISFWTAWCVVKRMDKISGRILSWRFFV